MKRGELVSEVSSRADDSNYKVARVNEYQRWVTLAVRNIWNAWPWSFAIKRETVQTTADDGIVLLPIGAYRPKRVQNLDTTTILEPEVERVLQESYPVASDTGEPLFYCDGGLLHDDLTLAPQRQMRVYPVPDKIYNIEVSHLRRPATMTEDNHFSPLPEDFDEAVILWCLVRAYRKLEDLQQAREHHEMFREEMDHNVSEFSVWQVDRYPRLELPKWDEF